MTCPLFPHFSKMTVLLFVGAAMNTGLYFPQLSARAKLPPRVCGGRRGAGDTSTPHLTQLCVAEAVLEARMAESLKLPSTTQSLLIDQKICPRHGRPRTQGLNQSHSKSLVGQKFHAEQGKPRRPGDVAITQHSAYRLGMLLCKVGSTHSIHRIGAKVLPWGKIKL